MKVSASSPFYKFVAVTPSDATVIPKTRGLWIGGAGAISVRDCEGNTTLLSGIPAGTLLNIQVDQVRSTSTTATLIVALY